MQLKKKAITENIDVIISLNTLYIYTMFLHILCIYIYYVYIYIYIYKIYTFRISSKATGFNSSKCHPLISAAPWVYLNSNEHLKAGSIA